MTIHGAYRQWALMLVTGFVIDAAAVWFFIRHDYDPWSPGIIAFLLLQAALLIVVVRGLIIAVEGYHIGAKEMDARDFLILVREQKMPLTGSSGTAAMDFLGRMAGDEEPWVKFRVVAGV